jgi:hypothetical protein
VVKKRSCWEILGKIKDMPSFHLLPLISAKSLLDLNGAPFSSIKLSVVFLVQPKITLKEIDFHPLKKRLLNDRD